MVDDRVVQRAVRFHVRHRRAGNLGETVEGADLIDDVGRQVAWGDVDEPASEPGEVVVATWAPIRTVSADAAEQVARSVAGSPA